MRVLSSGEHWASDCIIKDLKSTLHIGREEGVYKNLIANSYINPLKPAASENDQMILVQAPT